jgi:hypothetical protein
MNQTCKHGMPLKFGCDDCIIADLHHQLRTMQMERDAARTALNYILQSNKHVGTIHFRDHRINDYAVEWHDLNLRGTVMLFAKVSS